MPQTETRPAAQYGSVYPLPYHDVEKQRLRKQHNSLMGIMRNNPIHANISGSSPRKIVDVGCGMNADMTMYFAKRFPDAQVYAVDLAPVNIPKEHIPTNVVFIQGNIVQLSGTDPRLANGTVDFLYSRLLASGMQNWREYIQCVSSLLSSGGVTEMHDFAGATLMEDGVPAFGNSEWRKYSNENVPKKMKLDANFDKADDIMKDLGLKDTFIKQYRLPWGAATDESEQAWVSEGREQWYAALTMYTKNLVADESQAMQDEIMNDLRQLATPPVEGVYFPFYVAWGRKP